MIGKNIKEQFCVRKNIKEPLCMKLLIQGRHEQTCLLFSCNKPYWDIIIRIEHRFKS